MLDNHRFGEQGFPVAPDTPLEDLQSQARRLRDKAFGGLVTYSPKVFIPLTQLCRDVCHYCTFAQSPRQLESPFLTPEAVLEIARAGEQAGCREALLTLGEKPERRYRVAREWLSERGYASTIEYVVAICELLLAETRLLPHVNAGTLTRGEIARLRPVMASMGLMLESGSPDLLAKDRPHYGSPDKAPWRRLATLVRAGQQQVPTTTGLLIGIGESREQRLADLHSLARIHARYGNLQEVIIQNFKAKDGTRMAGCPDTAASDLLWTIAAARLILPTDVSIQAPPNLSPENLLELADSGLNDWGGVSPVTPDHVNPEAPWPECQLLAEQSATAGKALRARLPVYPPFVANADWLAPAVRRRCLEHADSQGLLRSCSWRAGESAAPPKANPGVVAVTRRDPSITEILARRIRGEEISLAAVTRLFLATGIDAEAILRAADELRAEQVGDAVTYVVNRNINYTNVCQYSCAFCAFSKGLPRSEGRDRPYDITADELRRRVLEAHQLGATEVCLQGGIHPGYNGDTYRQIVETARAAVPDIHIHAFSPLELSHGAETLGLPLAEYLAQLQAAGLDTVPGTAAEILDDRVRALICPDKLTTRDWLDTVATAHRVGLRSTATMMFGHVDTPEHWSIHLLRLRELQLQTGGFTEFVALPFVANEAPLYRRGLARPGPTYHECRMLHAVARIVLGDCIPNIQASWTKLGREGALNMLDAGVNDLGGCLMNESISRAAGASHGQCWLPRDMVEAIAQRGREPVQRTTLYAPAQGPLMVRGQSDSPAPVELTPAAAGAIAKAL